MNPNEKQPKPDEFSVSLERELVSNFAVRVTGIYSRTINIHRVQNNLRPYETYNIPITNRDPGPDGELGTADDGGLITYYEFRRHLQGAQFEEFMLINDPNADRDLQEHRSWRPSNGSRTGGSSWPPTRPRRKTDPSFPT